MTSVDSNDSNESSDSTDSSDQKTFIFSHKTHIFTQKKNLKKKLFSTKKFTKTVFYPKYFTKNQNVTKIKNSKFDKTEQLKMRHNTKTKNVTKLSM